MEGDEHALAFREDRRGVEYSASAPRYPVASVDSVADRQCEWMHLPHRGHSTPVQLLSRVHHHSLSQRAGVRLSDHTSVQQERVLDRFRHHSARLGLHRVQRRSECTRLCQDQLQCLQ